MAYTVTAIDPVLGGTLLRVQYRQDGGPVQRVFFEAADLRRPTEGKQFAEMFPLWLRAQAADKSVDLKTVTLAALRTFCVGKTLPGLPTLDAAKAADGV